jgi:hypothetical protein
MQSNEHQLLCLLAMSLWTSNKKIEVLPTIKVYLPCEEVSIVYTTTEMRGSTL